MEFYDTSQLSTEQAKRSYTLALLRINPNGGSPILAMSGLAGTKRMSGIGHTYATKTSEFVSLQLTTAIAADSTTTFIALAADVLKLVPNMVLRYQSLTDASVVEHVLVVSITNATDFVVTRGFGGTTAQAVIATSALLIDIGTAFEQGSLPPSPKSIGISLVTNFSQIFRNAYGNSKTLTASQVEFGDGNLAENKRDSMFFHGTSIETSILFGQKSPSDIGDTAPVYNSRPITTMNGIEASIRENAPSQIFNAASTTTFDQLEAFLDPCLDQQTNMSSSMDRVMYVGKTAMKVINNIGKLEGVVQSTVETTKFGQRFRNFQTTRGNFRVIEHPILNTNPTWAKMAFVLDFSAFDLRWLRMTETEEIKGTGRDEDAGVMTSELTLEFGNPFSCAVIHGLTAAA